MAVVHFDLVFLELNRKMVQTMSVPTGATLEKRRETDVRLALAKLLAADLDFHQMEATWAGKRVVSSDGYLMHWAVPLFRKDAQRRNSNGSRS